MCKHAGFIQELNTSKPLYEALIQAVDCFEESHVHSQGSSADDGEALARVSAASLAKEYVIPPFHKVDPE